MQNQYFSYLNQRALQRRLAAKFRHPRWLAIHIVIFVIVMTAIWAYGVSANLWFYRVNFDLPTYIGFVWSLVLAFHAVRDYWRSAARAARREFAVEDEMQQFIEKHGDEVDDETLFAMHRSLEADLERQGQWSTALMVFAIVNALSWIGTTASMGTSWGFQLTLPSALLVIGGVKLFLHWQQTRRTGRTGWFSRLPLWHIGLYGFGMVILAILSSFRAIHPWDAETVVKLWGLALIVHLVLAVILLPILQSAVSAVNPAEKRKHAPRWALAADGEIVERFEGDDAEAYLVEQPARRKRE